MVATIFFLQKYARMVHTQILIVGITNNFQKLHLNHINTSTLCKLGALYRQVGLQGVFVIVGDIIASRKVDSSESRLLQCT